MDISLDISQAEKYPAKQHAERVASQIGSHDGLIYLLGQYAYDKEDSDMPKTWYQRRFFYYMSGVDEPNACLTYNIKTRELVLYIEEIDWDRLIWTGRGSTIDEAKEKYDVDDVRLNPQLFPDIRQWLDHSKGKLFALHKEQIPKDIDGLHERLDADVLVPAMDVCRSIKDAHEIDLIKKANAISDAAHRAVLTKIATASNEAQLSAVFQDVCISAFAVQAYLPIVGSGPNASTLHYTANNQSLEGRQLICLDAGAAEKLYASDVTRTFPINGQWTREGREIYHLVERIQETCIAMCKPGTHMLDLHRLCHDMVVRGLLEIGVLHNGKAEEIYKAGTSSAFYMHGLGHHLGLETHDCQSLPIMRYKQAATRGLGQMMAPCREDSPHLEPGHVVTIEPGVYFNKQFLERNYFSKPEHARYINKAVLEKYFAVGGVRIEDDILITKHGYENLTTAPKGEEALEIILEAYFDDLYSKIVDWHGLDHKAFGKLRKFTDVKTMIEKPGYWKDLRAYLFDNMFLLVEEIHDAGEEEGPKLDHLGLTGCVEFKLRQSLLMRKHLVDATVSKDDLSTLRLETRAGHPEFWLHFKDREQCLEWRQAVLDITG